MLRIRLGVRECRPRRGKMPVCFIYLNNWTPRYFLNLLSHSYTLFSRTLLLKSLRILIWYLKRILRIIFNPYLTRYTSYSDYEEGSFAYTPIGLRDFLEYEEDNKSYTNERHFIHYLKKKFYIKLFLCTYYTA